MALHTLGTNASSSLNAITYQAASVLSPADLGTLSQGIVSDVHSQATNPSGVLTTGTTHTSTTIDTIASMTRITTGMFVLGVGVVPGTVVIAVNVGGSSVTLSKATTASASGVHLLFVPVDMEINAKLSFNGQLYIPRRGVLQVLPGDVIGVDPTTGWPILLSAAAIAAGGSVWTLT